jgi:hypothetical protein
MQAKIFKMRIFLLCLLVHALSGCSGAPAKRDSFTFRDGSSPEMLERAEDEAASGAAKILATARRMTVDEKAVLPGACWDYVNAVWKRAGFPSSRRKTVFKGGKKGPFADSKLIQPGDWLYFINHSYNDIEHSSLFIAWADKGAKEGYLLSYAGERRAEPARYKRYDLHHVYQIIRAAD